MRKIFKHTWQQLQKLILPRQCLLCRQPSQREIDLCFDCETELPWSDTSCYYCGSPLSETNYSICGKCITNPPAFNRTIAIFTYEFPIDNWINTLKFHQQLVVANTLGNLAASRIQAEYTNTRLPECIIPIPLHPKRTRERGYNQALEIAKHLAKQLKIPLDVHSCIRQRYTQAQTLTPAKLRKKNVKHAFYIKPILIAKHIAIVDDVVTTGHTIQEAATTLRDSGVQQIDVWCIAKTKNFFTSR